MGLLTPPPPLLPPDELLPELLLEELLLDGLYVLPEDELPLPEEPLLLLRSKIVLKVLLTPFEPLLLLVLLYAGLPALVLMIDLPLLLALELLYPVLL